MQNSNFISSIVAKIGANALHMFIIGMLLLSSCKKDADALKSKLFVPDGFSSAIVIDSLEETVRHIAVNDKGVIYAKLRNATMAGSVAALKDTDGDVKADIVKKFLPYGEKERWSYATEAKIYNGYLYYSSDLIVYRVKLDENEIEPIGEPEIMLVDDHEHGKHEHITKPVAFDGKGNMYVPFGAPGNACQQPKRTPGAAGLDPCPQLEDHAGIWRFDANELNQTQKDGTKYATGIRSIVGMDWNPIDDNLYVVAHGRDHLIRMFPDKYGAWESAMLPSEKFLRVTEGSDFGWPYCYYDQMQQKNLLNPEYGGDGETVGRCDQFDGPVIGFPGHWAPNDIMFYKGGQFPDRYKNGAFIAFHGSTDRSPYPQAGYFVAFIPFKNGQATGEWEVFADGFAEVDPIINTKDAAHRPVGLATGPDGELYISDSVKGKIWKITFNGDKATFGKEQLFAMEERKKLSNLRTPDREKDNLLPKNLRGGAKVYQQYCSACHQMNGRGASGRFPPLADTDWVTGDKERLIKIILNGMEGSLVIRDEVYNGVMPQHSFLSDKEIAEVLTFVRSSFKNDASAVSEVEVEKVRTTQAASGEKIGPIKVTTDM